MKSELQHVQLHERVTVISLPPRRPKPLSVRHLQPHHLLNRGRARANPGMQSTARAARSAPSTGGRRRTAVTL